MWELINKINGKLKDKTCIVDYLRIDKVDYFKGKDIANHFAKYFSSVGKEFALKTESPKNSLKKLLAKNV